jgi:glycosyltransferase involved in cell wall biosynthesis
MDYVIREVAELPEPRPYLLLLGQQEAESTEVINFGKKMLGEAGFEVRTVAKDEVAAYYKAADAFTLASLSEGFGRVFVEAMSYGLPCLAHDYEVSKYVLGNHGYYGDFKLKGSLASLVKRVLAAEGDSRANRDLRYRHVLERFSWNKLSAPYAEMLQRCAQPETATG